MTRAALPAHWYEVCLSRYPDDPDEAVRMAAFATRELAMKHLNRLDAALSNSIAPGTGEITEKAEAAVEKLTGRPFDLDEFEGVQLTVWKASRKEWTGTIKMECVEITPPPPEPEPDAQ